MTARVRSAWESSRIGALLRRYGDRNGSLFAGGLAYGLLFAFFAGVWASFSVLGVVFAHNDRFRSAFLSVLSSVVPTVTSGSNAVVSEASLGNISTTFTVTGVITVIAFWWQITNWLGSLRSAIRTILGGQGERGSGVEGKAAIAVVEPRRNPLRARLVDTGVVLLVAVLFILTTVAGVVSGGVVNVLMQAFGIDSSWLTGVVTGLSGIAVAVVANMALLIVLFRVVCQVRWWRGVLVTSVCGAVALSVIQLLGGRLLTGASSNPLLAPFAAIIAVLIWFNIVARVLMYCAALLGEMSEKKGREETFAR